MRPSRDIESSLPPPVLSAGRRFIVSIGIDRYSRWTRLRNAENDAREVASVFLQLGFEAWCAPLTNEAATFDTLRRLVLVDLPAALGEEDSLVLFFAGHGHLETKTIHGTKVSVGYVIPFDGASKQSDRDAWLQLGAWLKDIARLPPRHILVILDCCHSGMALDIPRGGEGSSPAFDELRLRRSRRVIASAMDDQRGMDGGPLVDHSLFTGCLLEGLSGDLGKAAVTGSEIGAYLQRRVTEYPDSKQTPVSGIFDLDDRGELIVPTLTSPAEPAPHPTSIAARARSPRKGRSVARLLSMAAVLIVTSRCLDQGQGASSHATPPPGPSSGQPDGPRGDCRTSHLLPSVVSPSPADQVCKARGGWLSRPDGEPINDSDCPVLSIDDIQVFRNEAETVLAVRLRNSSRDLINITRAMLDTRATLDTGRNRNQSAVELPYIESQIYFLDFESGAPRADNEISIAHALPAASVDAFRICGRTNVGFVYLAQLTLVYNGNCRVRSSCFSLN
jgi:hypothetical protein